MAEAAIREVLDRDSNGDGVPDIFDKLLSTDAFGQGKDNWRNRRILFVVFIIVMMLIVFSIGMAWVICALAGIKLDNNTADLGAAIFWGASINATGALGTYAGVATWDHASQRRAMTTAADKLSTRASQPAPGAGYPPPNNPTPYGPENGPYVDPYPGGAPYQFNTAAPVSPTYPPPSTSAAPRDVIQPPLPGLPVPPTVTGVAGDPPGGF
jgi:hypothetical protein